MVELKKQKPEWWKYEAELFEHFKFEHPESTVIHDTKLPGLKSGIDRQVDILIQESLGDSTIRTVIEAKHYKRKVDVKQVESILGMLDDIGVDRGILITTQGYSKAALTRAHRDDVQLELDIYSTAELSMFQSHTAIPYAGDRGVLMLAPLGWIVDGSSVNNAVATLYRRGLTFPEAGLEKEFMYINFWKKKPPSDTLEKLIESQNTQIHQRFPAAKTSVEYSQLGKNRRGAIRVHKNPLYPSLEGTGYSEFEDFILFAVLFTPEITLQRNLRKLDYLLRRAIPIKVRHEPKQNN